MVGDRWSGELITRRRVLVASLGGISILLAGCNDDKGGCWEVTSGENKGDVVCRPADDDYGDPIEGPLGT